MVEDGRVRINRQPTVKPHARVRVGDVLTIVGDRDVHVWRIAALAPRRGDAVAARTLYEPVPE